MNQFVEDTVNGMLNKLESIKTMEHMIEAGRIHPRHIHDIIEYTAVIKFSISAHSRLMDRAKLENPELFEV